MWVLIFIVALSGTAESGPTSVTQEFSSKEKCLAAASLLQKQAKNKGSYVLNLACVEK